MALSETDIRAISLFELAMEKEQHGSMSDAVGFYRQAFKLNEQVDRLYRQEKVPPAIQKLKAEHGKNVARKVDEEVVRKIDVDRLLELWEHTEAQAPSKDNPDQWNEDVVVKIDNLTLNGPLEEVAPLIHLPGEVWVRVLGFLQKTEPDLWVSFGMTCKRHAHLAFALSALWEKLCYLIYPCQRHQTAALNDPKELYSRSGTWKNVLRQNPYVKFMGCYISVVNYYTEGGRGEYSLNWSNPVKTNTYYRYLRLYPDGACLMALTALDPRKVVHQMTKSNTDKCIVENRDVPLHFNPATHPHKIYSGTWSITKNGELEIRLYQGSVPYYTFYYYFKIQSIGHRPNYSKLLWVRYFAVEKTPSGDAPTGDEVNFSLKSETSFKFSRVKSYTDE